ncbi:MAG: GGDEF domain-containing protein [Desulfovibrio sp.]|nr:GGDEF domain-containing protein [Desulfovibrio sp.]
MSSVLAASVLKALDIAVLRRKGPLDYEIYGQTPEFYEKLFRENASPAHTRPWEKSAMLRLFLSDAELFFDSNQTGLIFSGIWREEGLTGPGEGLSAQALNLDAEKFLILRLLGDEFTGRTRILQESRDGVLNRRKAQNHEGALFQSDVADPDRETSLRNLYEILNSYADTGPEFSLLMLDIDDFTTLNAVYGQDVCDAALVALSDFLGKFKRIADKTTSCGGGAFAVVAPSTGQSQSLRMAEKLRRAINEQTFGALPPITVSIGCSTSRTGEQQAELVARAQLALRDSKQDGKNLVRLR